MKVLWFGALLCLGLLFLNPPHALAQLAPGQLADANQPSGAPDPEKIDDVWSVDPINDQVAINIPITTTPQGGRGPKIPFALMYNSGSTVTLQANGTVPLGGGSTATSFSWSAHPIAAFGSALTAPSGPWTTTGPYYSLLYPNNVPDWGFTDTNGQWQPLGAGCVITGPYNYTDPNGATHDMNLLSFYSNSQYIQSPGYQPVCAAAHNSAGYWPNSATSDGSAIATSAGQSVDPNGVINGTLDANGNRVSISTVSGVTTVKDALGRTVYVTNIPIGQPGKIPAGTYYVTTYGPTGTAENYSVVFSNISIGSFTMPHPTLSEVTSAAYCTTCNTITTINQPVTGDKLTGITQLTRPDGSSYTFTYDPTYGTISTITFPTGGTVSFTWGIRDRDWSPYGQYDAISSIVVTSATVSGGTTSGTWEYAMESLTTSSTPIGQMQAPDGSTTSYKGSCFVYTAVPFYAYQAKASCKESSHTTRSSSGSLIESRAETFGSSALPVQIVSTTYDGPSPLQKQVVNYYDSYANITEKDESDFYPCAASNPDSTCPVPSMSQGPFLRKTFTAFAYTTNASLASAHIVNKPSQIIVTDGNGTPYSMTTYSYDAHGNLQNEGKCITISGSGASATCSSVWQTQFNYDGTGQLLSKTEAYGTLQAATTSLTWTGPSGTSDAYNGYLTKVTHPNGAIDSYTYSGYTGQVLSHTDWNGQSTGLKTTYSYVDPTSGTPDPLNRIRTITAPQTTDGTTGSSGNGLTKYTYSDSPGSFSIQEQHTITGSTTTSTTKNFDGLGRVSTVTSQVPATECSSGIITVQTTYDSMSRVESVSNPFCSTNNASTSYLYDALGRKTQTTLPGGAVSTISYGGNATEMTDPFNGTTNVQHIQQVDGLGHLTDVCEVSASALGNDSSPANCGLNITGTGYHTIYTYDPLGNMRTVSQHGQSRSFTYDKLSRLSQAINPEVGSDVYAYSTPSSTCAADPSLPCTRTDARGVITTYTYDNMDRLVSKSFSLAATNSVGTISDLCPATSITYHFLV